MKNTVSLKENHEFRRLYHRGKSAATHYLVVYVRKTKRPYNRLGLTVSVKIGGAVARNRVKRMLREAYRLREASVMCGLDIVIVARKSAVEVKTSEIEKALAKAFCALGLYAEEAQP